MELVLREYVMHQSVPQNLLFIIQWVRQILFLNEEVAYLITAFAVIQQMKIKQNGLVIPHQVLSVIQIVLIHLIAMEIVMNLNAMMDKHMILKLAIVV